MNFRSKILNFFFILISGVSAAYSQINLELTYKQSLYMSSNLPNLENSNGLYLPKGFGSFSTFGMGIENKYFSLSIEPNIILQKSYDIDVPKKESLFSVLNDVPKENYKYPKFNNLGLQIKLRDIGLGFGNWSRWWGPGLHNSLVLSNNAPGFYHYYLGNINSIKISNYLSYKFSYIVSTSMKNQNNYDYYFSAWFFVLNHELFELGISRNILSGGIELDWNIVDAMTVLLNNKNILLWDTINEFYLKIFLNKSNLEVFFDVGIPNRSFAEKNPGAYSNHALATNLGFIKKRALGTNNLLYGMEYTRIIQGIYYNILPTPNWYDNHKYNYSSFNGFRWSAHSGSDSDDFLIFIGYDDNIISFLYGVNYERHGITYHFPPEVKFESRFNISYKINDYKFSIIYENEYFEHYSFVDSYNNVWDETFEKGSIQRTKTLLFSLYYTIF